MSKIQDCHLCKNLPGTVGTHRAPWAQPDPVEGWKNCDTVPCPFCRSEEYKKALAHYYEPVRIAGRTQEEWRTFSRRDDCLDRMVPSDLRQLLHYVRFEK